MGPGLSLDWQSDFIGPISTDSIWRVEVFGADPERAFYYEEVPTIGVKGGGTRLSTDLANRGAWQEESLADDTQVTVHLRLIESDNDIDSGSITAPWKPTVGLATQAYYLAWQVRDAAGMPPEQVQMLTEVHDWLHIDAVDGGGNPVQTTLRELLHLPAFDFWNLEPAVHVLTGRGELDVPRAGNFWFAFGMRLHVNSTPPGFGTRDGAVETWQARIGQFVAIVISARNNEALPYDFVDLHEADRAWLFTQRTQTVLYDITPGCEVTYRWLTEAG